MKTDMHKDWTDAFRESFPQEAMPAAGGWEAVAGRMRRASARRRAAVAAAALALPIAAGLFMLPSRHATIDNEIAVVQDIVETVPSAGLSLLHDEDIISSEAKGSATSTLIAGIPAQDNGSSVPFDAQSEPGDRQADHDETKDLPGQIPTNTNTNTNSVTSTDLSDLFYEEDGDEPARGRRLAIGLGAAATAGGTPTVLTTTGMASDIVTKASNNFFNNTTGTILRHNYVHDLPVSIGLSVRYGLTDRIWLESGLEYTKLHSRLDGLHTVMHYAGIPLRANYRLFSTGRFEGYAGIGGKAEKCLKATLGGLKVAEPSLQWSGSALLGAQVRITRSAWIYIQPDLTYYFTKSNLVSYRTENRLGLTFNAGLRFDLTSNNQ